MFESSILAELSGLGTGLPSIHGGGDAAGGGWVGLLDQLLDKLTRATEPGGGLEVLPGIQLLGSNIHPLLVHFPIALLSLFLLLDILGTLRRNEAIQQAAGILLYCGTLGALASVAAGLYAASIVPHDHVVHEIMAWHERLGLTATGLALVLSLWQFNSQGKIAGMAKALQLFLASLMIVCVVFGADLGGLMVYGHGVAVQKLQDANAQHHHAVGP